MTATSKWLLINELNGFPVKRTFYGIDFPHKSDYVALALFSVPALGSARFARSVPLDHPNA